MLLLSSGCQVCMLVVNAVMLTTVSMMSCPPCAGYSRTCSISMSNGMVLHADILAISTLLAEQWVWRWVWVDPATPIRRAVSSGSCARLRLIRSHLLEEQ